MKFIFTCGGTAGHINPALAVAGRLKELLPDSEFLFLGAEGKMEMDLVPREGYQIKPLKITNLSRGKSLKALRHNLNTVKNVALSYRQAKAIIRDFQPDAVIGTGGYVCYPVLKAASRLHVPTAVHESNAVPGLTTKMLARLVDRIMVGFEESRQYYPQPEKVIVTGTPVRGDFFNLTHDEAKAALGLGAEEPLVVSFWGSLGASTMNRQMLDFFEKEKADGYPFRHIHAVGSGNWEWMQQELRQRDLTGNARLDVRQYIYDMAVVMRAADLVICRAGASTISEITALAVPTIIVPSPYVANNHQEKNARILAQHGGACLIREEESSGGKLYRTARDILDSPTRRESMSRGMAELGILDATERIYQTVMELVR